EVDETALRNRADQADTHAVADIEAFISALDAAFDRRVQDPYPGALGRRAGHDAVELLTDAARQKASRRRFAHHALDLLGSIFFQRAFAGERAELVLAVRHGLLPERGAYQTLRDQVRVAPVGRGRVGVLIDGETEVADDGLAGEARQVLATPEQFDDRQREIGKAQRVGRAPLEEKGVESRGIGLTRQRVAVFAGQRGDALPALR